MLPEPVTATAAAARLGKQPATIRKWAQRYGARQLGTQERRVYYCYADLATIDGCITRREPVPDTPEERDQLRAALRTRWQNAA
ncbi:hypothetical protein AB0L05_27770 [Nonomuraea pusilla]